MHPPCCKWQQVILISSRIEKHWCRSCREWSVSAKEAETVWSVRQDANKKACYRFQPKKMFQAGEGEESNTGEKKELTTVVSGNMEGAIRQEQTHSRGKDKKLSLSPHLPPSPFLPTLHPFLFSSELLKCVRMLLGII